MAPLRTERLVLREWRDDDLDPFATINADPEVMEHFPALLTRAETAAAIDRFRGHFAREGFGLWVIEAPGAPFVGFAGLARPAFMPASVEIGWRLARPYWGHGYATEAASEVLRQGFEVHGLDEIVSFTVASNTRSQQVMVRIGMTRDLTADFDHPRIQAGHRLQRHCLYRLTCAQWRQSRNE
jgi:RimJ/RimL family protein N-acetyltransferase